MKQSKTVAASKPRVAGKTPGKDKIRPSLTQEIRQNNSHLDGLDKYFQVLPLVENFLNETDPELKKSKGIFFTPYPVVSFIVRSIHEILKKKLGKPLGLADETVKILDPATGTGVFLITAARLVIDEITRKYEEEKAHTFARQFMLNNLYGIEKEMSLYAKMGTVKKTSFFLRVPSRVFAVYFNRRPSPGDV